MIPYSEIFELAPSGATFFTFYPLKYYKLVDKKALMEWDEDADKWAFSMDKSYFNTRACRLTKPGTPVYEQDVYGFGIESSFVGYTAYNVAVIERNGIETALHKSLVSYELTNKNKLRNELIDLVGSKEIAIKVLSLLEVE